MKTLLFAIHPPGTPHEQRGFVRRIPLRMREARCNVCDLQEMCLVLDNSEEEYEPIFLCTNCVHDIARGMSLA